MEGNGPGLGTPRALGLILAAEDGVALDTIGAQIVGYPLEELRVYRAARDLGVGCSDPERIELFGDLPLAVARVADWKWPESLPIFFNPARVGWSTAKQALFLLKMKTGRTG